MFLKKNSVSNIKVLVFEKINANILWLINSKIGKEKLKIINKL